jgi:hypothetical protein
MKQHCFGQNASFHLNEKAAKCVRVHIGPHFVICSIVSSIAILIVKINSITSPALKLAAFFKLVLGLDLVQFDPQLSNKLLISSIGPINIWFWTFLPQIEFSSSTGLSSVNKILPNFNLCIFKPPQPIFDHFLSALTSSSHYYYFL